MLEEGVQALRKDRFRYTPAGEGLQRRLAELYVTRGGWGKYVGVVVIAVAVIWGGRYLLVDLPQAQATAALPQQVESAAAAVLSISTDDEAVLRAEALRVDAETALARGDLEAANEALDGLETLRAQLEQSYDLRVVSRPGEDSGVWRIPDVNTQARNYYLIVEAVQHDGSNLRLPISSEEDGNVRHVEQWGIRVNESSFRSFAEDKQADGIIDDPSVGSKRRGRLEVEYSVETSGGAITDW